MKNYYEHLELPPTASADEIKRAFRQQIVRYHPDKVQHLGTEFQAMAAERAAELTEAYRVLSHEGRRAEYDAALLSTLPAAAPPRAPAAGETPSTGRHQAPATDHDRQQPGAVPKSAQFVQERASRDEFVRRATVDRFRQAFDQVAGSGYDDSQVRGFDVARVPKAKLFGRNKRPRVVGRYVPTVDAAAVAEAWMHAVKWGVPAGEEVCVILMGTAVAPPRELADAIAEQRRRPSRSGGKVTLIPVNIGVWDAHMPTDAPSVAKDLLAKLRSS